MQGTSPINKKKAWQREILILLLYAFVFCVLTYPLLLQFSSSIIGTPHSDASIFLWNAWQFEKKLLSADFSYTTSDIFFPHSVSLLTHTYTQFQSFLVFLVNRIFDNIVLSFNIIFLLSSVACAYFSYRFFLLHTTSALAAVLGGLFFTFQPLWSLYAHFGTQNLISLWYLPLALYLFALSHTHSRKIFSFGAGSVWGLSLVNDLYVFVFTGVALVLYAVSISAFAKSLAFRRVGKMFFFVCVGFAVTAGWKIWIMVHHSREFSRIPLPSTADVDYYHTDIINLIRPSALHPIWGNLHTLWIPSSLTNGNEFIGFTALILILLAIMLKITAEDKSIPNPRSDACNILRRKMFWFSVSGYSIALLLALGPFLHIFGKSLHIPMPYVFLHKILPAIYNLRVPIRWLMLAQFFLAGIIVVLAESIFVRYKRPMRIFVFVIFILGMIVDVSYIPQHLLPIYGQETTLFENIRDNKENKTFLYLPFSISDGYFLLGEKSLLPLAYQVVVQQPMLNGHISRLDPALREAYAHEPVLKYLLQYQSLQPDLADIDEFNLRHFFATYNVATIVLDKRLVDLETTQATQLIDYLTNALGFALQSEYSNAQIYKK